MSLKKKKLSSQVGYYNLLDQDVRSEAQGAMRRHIVLTHQRQEQDKIKKVGVRRRFHFELENLTATLPEVASRDGFDNYDMI